MEEKEVSAAQVVESLVRIARKIERRERAREAHLQATHGRFNVFTTLLDASDEVRLHTRFLAHLLDTNGKHDCKRLFLDLFLDVVGLPELQNQKCHLVSKEHYTGDLGNIDIYLEFEQATIVIENKICAGDQEKQLERYAEYARPRKNDCHIFYLTPTGKDASPASLGSLPKEKVINISYRKEILHWLEQCLQQTYEFVNINQTIQQYGATVKQLLGITLETEDMNEIKEQIQKIPEIMANADQIMRALQEIKQDRKNEVKNECLKVLGPRVDKSWIADWDNIGTAFKFQSKMWGDEGCCDLTVLMTLTGRYSLIAYDTANGKIKRILDAGDFEGAWSPEGKFFRRVYASDRSLEEALAILKGVVSQVR